MVPRNLAQIIREEFKAGTLRVRSVDPATCKVHLSPLADVLKHDTAHKGMLRVTFSGGGSVVCTEDHSLFLYQGDTTTPIPGDVITPGMVLTAVGAEGAEGLAVESVEGLPPQAETYDLSVPGDQNFVLSNGVLAHNSYSIGGVSLDIDKSSKYESMKQNAKAEWDQHVESKLMTVKILRGLAQPRFGVGVRSSFGPNVGKGVLSPKSFLVFAMCVFFFDLFASLGGAGVV